MTRVFFTSETAKLAGKRSGEARRAHKANGPNGATQTLLASVAEQGQTSDELATLVRRLDAKVLRALDQKVDEGKARVGELLAYYEWRGMRPPRARNQASDELEATIKALVKGEIGLRGLNPICDERW
jgi:hypothetical protein